MTGLPDSPPETASTSWGRLVATPILARMPTPTTQCQPSLTPLLIPLADRMLDQGGRVAFIVRPSADRSLLSPPLDVELHMAESDEQYHAFLGDAMRWSDALVVCESAMSPRELAGEMQKHRLSSEYDYAQILMRADYVCGAGACMACVVQRSDGSLTRACVHGPVFPLSDLLR